MKKERMGYLILIIAVLSLATGRWGSWLGFPGTSFFFFDIALLLLFFLSWGSRFPPRDFFVFIVIFIYVLFEIFRSRDYGLFLRLRDLAPFLYLMLFIRFRSHIINLNLQVVMKYFRIGSLAALMWTLAISTKIVNEFTIGDISGVPIFSLRADHFGFVAAIGIISWAQLDDEIKLNRLIKPIIIGAFLLEVSLLPGRAGGLSALVGVAYLILYSSRNSQNNRRLGFFIISFVIVVSSTNTIFSTLLPENSFLKRAGLITGSEVAEASGTGTATARLSAQKMLISWVQENNLEIFGAGPGREMLFESGAYRFLSGSVEVRQPHNWWISIYARFGLFGALLWCALLFHFWKPFKRENQYREKNLFLIAILISASFGVILESPFGLIPFYFILMTSKSK